jgi:predicted RNA-binding protein YlxR (DUF448 family)
MNKPAEKNERRCVLTGESKSRADLIRLVIGPDETIVPDLAEKLPGRGVWITADRGLLEKALTSGKLTGSIARSLKTKVSKNAADENFAERLKVLLEKRCLARLGLEQRAGNVVTGFDKIKTEMTSKNQRKAHVLLTASDGSEDSKRKMHRVIGDVAVTASPFDREALSQVLGKDNVVHALVFESGGAKILAAEISRLTRYCGDTWGEAAGQRNDE